MPNTKKLKFDELSLSAEMQSAISDMGFSEASPIQSEAIPHILEGRDVIGQAQTGTGKTGAFGIPLLEKLDPKEKFVAALVMCPTRELALQVSLELKKFAKHKRGVHVLAVYGGEPMGKQIQGLRAGAHVVVGTPGRILDHLNRKTLVLDKIKMIVLDEADEMLNMGFREDIETILADMPEERQTVFFSATMPKPILDLTRKYQRDPVLVKMKSDHLTATSIEQVYIETRESEKVRAISSLMNFYEFKLALVFCNMKIRVDELVAGLQEAGIRAAGIHGDLKQNQRSDVLAAFRRGDIRMLVATDVAARGLDVNDVDAVFNFDMPLDPEYYVHRVGRTGRAGKSGKAFSFVTGRNELRRLSFIERYAKIKIERVNLPSAKEMAGKEKEKLLLRIKEIIEAGDLGLYEKAEEEFRDAGVTLHQLTLALLKISLPGLGKKDPPAQRPMADFNSRGSYSSDSSNGSYAHRSHSRGGSEGYDQPRGPRVPRETDADMVRLFIGVGKEDHVRPGDLVGAIAGESDIPGKSIGAIQLLDRHSFVDVKKDDVSKVLDRMKEVKIKGRRTNIRLAKP